ncbi:MAG: GreA/GreB family elongation factor [Gammaproteobacteria bacterium]
MSRAFVKEPDGEQADQEVIERPQSEFPNYITMPGLTRLKTRLEELRLRQKELKSGDENLSVKDRLRTLEAEIRYLDKRVQCAIPVEIHSQPGADIRFGATVHLVDENNRHYTFIIVGEDEADADRGMLSWVSPLAREMIGKQAGACIVWMRPAGDLELEITGFSYQ